MKNKNLKSGVLTVVVLVGLVATNVLLNMQWLKTEDALAFAINSDENAISNTLTNAQGTSDVATDNDGNHIYVWESDAQTPDNDLNGIFFRRFDSKGVAIDASDTLVNTTTTLDQSNPVVAADTNGNFVVAWEGNGTGDTGGIFLQAFNSAGAPVGSEVLVNTTTAGTQARAGIAMDYNNASNAGNFVVSWYLCGNKPCTINGDVYIQRYTVDFTGAVSPSTAGSETQVNTTTISTISGYSPSVAMNNFGEILVTWLGNTSEVLIQAYDNSGTAWGAITQVQSTTSGSKISVVADKSAATVEGGNFFMTYNGQLGEDTNGGIFARMIPRCNASGCNIANSIELLVNTTTVGIQDAPDIAADGMGNFNVTWVSHEDVGGLEVYGQNYKYNKGQPYGAIGRVGTEFRVNSASNQGVPGSGEQLEPAVSMSTDGFYAISFTTYPSGLPTNADVYSQQFVSEMLRNGDETLNNPLDGGSPISQTSTDVAISNTGLTASVWVDQTDGGVKFTLRDTRNNNVVVGTAGTRVDNPSTAPNANPTVSFYKDTNSSSLGYGRFIIVWAGNGVGSDIYYREVDNAGNLLGTPTVLNTTTAGSQVAPHVEAGLYSFNTPTDATFSAVWLDENDGVVSTYYYQGVFTENIIEACDFSLSCTTTAVDLNPVTGDAVYAWDDDPTGDDLFAQRASLGGALVGSPIVVGIAGAGEQQYSPDVTFIKDGSQFLVSYVHEDINGNFVKAKVYNISNAVNTSDFYVSTCATTCDDTNPKVASTTPGFTLGDTGTLFVWNNSGSDYEITGALWRYNHTADTFERFSPNFRISDTQDGDQFLPSVSMAGYSNQMVVGWEGKWEDTPNTVTTTTDDEASVSQLLYNPVYEEVLPNLAPAAEQEIQQGGRTLSVPDTIVFPSVNVNPTTSTSAAVSIRDATNGGCTTDPVLDCTDAASKYIEISDLDGTPFTLTIIADSDFTNDADGQNYITRSNFFIRNWDQNVADTDTNCGTTPESCYLTINPLTPPVTPTFTLDTSTTTAQSLDVSQTLATKTGNDIGVWRIYPDWLLNIGALTPPGNHSTTVTITLQ